MRNMRMTRAVLILTAALSLGAAPAALAEDQAVATDVAEAVNAQDAAPAAANRAADVPESAAETATLKVGGGQEIGFDLPAVGDGTRFGLTTVFDGAAPGTQVAVQPTGQGLRALIRIDSPVAPERYTFPLTGDVADLKLQPDGSSVAYDKDGTALATVAPPWARDASGLTVPTHYEVDGTTLVQVVDHQGGLYDYAITADPWWVPIAVAVGRCQAHRYCRHVMNKNFWKGVKYALDHLF